MLEGVPRSHYGTVVADPPWQEIGGGRIVRGANRHYSLLSTEAICEMPVSEVALPDSHCYLWVTNNFLPDGLRVLDAWGFRYVTMITWAKDRFGLGQYFRGMTEHVLFGVRGNPGYRLLPTGRRAQGVTLITAPRGRHSAKPEQLIDMAERVSPGPYLEIFARATRPGWDSWGNQVDTSTLF